MAEFPALPLWTDAYLGDTRHLSQAEHGAYLLLLITAWRSPDCSLPDDDRLLARFANCDKRTWRRQKPTIMAFWSLDDGRWTQKRLSRERSYVAERSSKRAEAGGRGGRVSAAFKRLKNRESAEAKLGVLLKQNGSTHTHIHTSVEDKSSTGAGAPRDPQKEVYDLGKKLLGSGGLVTKLITHHNGDLVGTMHTLRLAAGKSDPKEYIGAILRGDRAPETDWDAEYRRMGVSL